MKLAKSFYQQPVLKAGKELLEKVLVHNTSQGRVSAIITDIEIYPANIEEVGHGTKKTPRTKILFEEGGFVYVYSIYGIHNCLAFTFAKKEIPDEVLIRGVYPLSGIEIMKKNYGKKVASLSELTNSPARLYKSMDITKKDYGCDLTKNKIFVEEVDIKISKIKSTVRIGLNKNKKGYNNPFRFFIEFPFPKSVNEVDQ